MTRAETRRSKRRTQDKSRSASRLAVVQALYQMELSGQDSETALNEFIEHRLGREIDGTQYVEADKKYFAGIIRGVVERQDEIDRTIAVHLVKEWSFDRIDPTMRAILRAAVFEMIAFLAVPMPVIVHEYMHVATAFFGKGDETAFLGGVLARMSRELRLEA